MTSISILDRKRTSNILDLMLWAERRDYVAQPMSEDEAMLCGYSPTTRAGTQWSVVGIVKEETEMELAVFGCANPMELYHEKEYYLDHPEALLDECDYPETI